MPLIITSLLFFSFYIVTEKNSLIYLDEVKLSTIRMIEILSELTLITNGPTFDYKSATKYQSFSFLDIKVKRTIIFSFVEL